MIFMPTPRIDFTNTPGEGLLRIVGAFNGVELAKLRLTNKKIFDFINLHENFLYERCMMHEYKKAYKKNVIPLIPRIDWKNVYIMTDQFMVTKKRGLEYREIIIYKKNFEIVEQVFFLIELSLSLVTGFVNIGKVASLGWSASRQLIHNWLSQNPGNTVMDALKALGMTTQAPVTIDFHY
jgi:hypothetical protein